MSEQKYYVFQKSLDGKKIVSQLVRYKLMSVDAKFVSVSRNKSGRYENSFSKFTKTELSKIMDGALYKQRDCLPFQWLYSREQLRNDLGWEYNETIDKWEWKNQLIELVPVEEV